MSMATMTATKTWGQKQRTWLSEASVLLQRELIDTLRDWRIIAPIVLLTLFFPFLMNLTAGLVSDWVARYGGAPIIGERIIPFLLMVVGFFPLSFSLVIALEVFVGEKERKSLEPLLASPLSNGQLYFGKTLASMIPPLVASYLGMAVYLIGLKVFRDWAPPFELLVLVVLLTTAKALVMVSGAVVISSQTTSVRAANLLASFIIIPMALLMQGESLIMFWANYPVLWWILAALLVVNVLLVRMGLHLFDREELLGREIDEFNPRAVWQRFRAFWLSVEPAGPVEPFTLGRMYTRDLPAILRRMNRATWSVVLSLAAALVLGWLYAIPFPLPSGIWSPSSLTVDAFRNAPSIGFLPSFTVSAVLSNNIRSLLLAGLLAVFSFGSLAIVLLMIPMGIIGFFTYEVAHWGLNPGLFLATFVLPHGIFELPAAILATAAALRLGTALIVRPPRMTVGEGWLSALADFIKVFIFATLPLLLVAAIVEVNLTLRVVQWVFAR
jgi:uncharacterized membrane protein SpoIIM required for sporulation/ABC-type transport system involved in multi-copper enzyme maturation permease subunit